MESKVEMDLAEYTNLIKENERLKAMLHTCHRLLEEKAKASVEVYTINDLTKEQCDNALKMDEKTLIYEYSYSRTFNDAIVEFLCFTIDEIKTVFAENIRQKIQKRIDELSEERA